LKQHPVRYYIVQADDQPVVRSVPVTPARRAHVPTPTAPADVDPAPERRARVHRLVRAAIRRERGRG
jgi:hypothetical protein